MQRAPMAGKEGLVAVGNGCGNACSARLSGTLSPLSIPPWARHEWTSRAGALGSEQLRRKLDNPAIGRIKGER